MIQRWCIIVAAGEVKTNFDNTLDVLPAVPLDSGPGAPRKASNSGSPFKPPSLAKRHMEQGKQGCHLSLELVQG